MPAERAAEERCAWQGFWLCHAACSVSISEPPSAAEELSATRSSGLQRRAMLSRMSTVESSSSSAALAANARAVSKLLLSPEAAGRARRLVKRAESARRPQYRNGHLCFLVLVMQLGPIWSLPERQPVPLGILPYAAAQHDQRRGRNRRASRGVPGASGAPGRAAGAAAQLPAAAGAQALAVLPGERAGARRASAGGRARCRHGAAGAEQRPAAATDGRRPHAAAGRRGRAVAIAQAQHVVQWHAAGAGVCRVTAPAGRLGMQQRAGPAAEPSRA